MCVSIPASYREPLADGIAVGRQHGRRGVAGTRSSARAVRTPTAPPGTRAKGGHYLVGLKGNQPTPHLEARLFFQEQPPRALLRAGPTLLPCRSTNIQLPTTSGHTTNHYIAMHDDEMTLRLARPSHLPEQLPHMAVGVLDPEQPSDHRSHTRTGPQVRGVPMGAWAPQEFLAQPGELLLRQPTPPSSRPLAAQRLHASFAPPTLPPVGGRHADPSRPATSVGPRPSSNSTAARRRCFSNSDWLDGLRASACPMSITTSQTTVVPFCSPSHLRRTH